MTTSEQLTALIKARDLIADPARWTTGAEARDSAGDETLPFYPDARRWCAVGAIAAHLPIGSVRWLALVQFVSGFVDCAALPAGPELPIIRLNDHVLGGHAAVLRAFDAAIAALAARVQRADDVLVPA